jgi:hypothetical protein
MKKGAETPAKPPAQVNAGPNGQNVNIADAKIEGGVHVVHNDTKDLSESLLKMAKNLDNIPKIEHPYISFSRPVRHQVQLFGGDKVRVFGPGEGQLLYVRFGGEWLRYNERREYIVIGYTGQPVTPEFEFAPAFDHMDYGMKLEVVCTSDKDKERSLNDPAEPAIKP